MQQANNINHIGEWLIPYGEIDRGEIQMLSSYNDLDIMI